MPVDARQVACWVLLVLAIGCLGRPVSADEASTVAAQPATSVAAAIAPTPDAIRQAVARTLPFMAKEGEKWMRDRGCITCHQIPSMIWSMNEARRHRFDVDAEKVTEWNQWALNNGLKRAVFYKVTGDVLTRLREEQLPDDELKKIEKLKNKNHVFERDFREALTKELSSESAARYQQVVLKAAAKGGQGGAGTGENNQYTALLLTGAPAAVDNSAEARAALVAGLVKLQKPDGSWGASGQFQGEQRSADEAVEVATLWTVLALHELPEPSADVAKGLAKAHDWLAKAADKPTVSTERLMLRAWLTKKQGDSAKSEDLASQLLKLQHADGGWGWLTDRETSDPFTTGMMLYGLHYLQPTGVTAAVTKGNAYLLKNQQADGVWKMERNTISKSTKPDTKDGDYIYTYWGTAWALLGLMQSL